jgi:hypothetical protein
LYLFNIVLFIVGFILFWYVNSVFKLISVSPII